MSTHDIARDAAAASGEAGRDPGRWPFDPSGWRERGPVLLLALLAVGVSFYLGMYQLHWTDSVWDPFFGGGSEHVLTSRFSELFPVPDALIGAGGYALEALLTALGGRVRYRTRPWLVFLYGAVVVGAGGVGISFALVQGAVVGDWCTLCLCNTIISVTVVLLSWPEVWAAALELSRRLERGDRLRDAMLGR